MYMLGYSVDNLSFMALAISTGFVVDDAIVVIENITRYLEDGDAPAMAAMTGAKEIAFTVLSMSISLVAVFIPILLMGGILGRLFREFSVTLAHRHRHFAGRVADDDAGHVRKISKSHHHEQKHGQSVSGIRKGIRLDSQRLSDIACAGSCTIRH